MPPRTVPAAQQRRSAAAPHPGVCAASRSVHEPALPSLTLRTPAPPPRRGGDMGVALQTEAPLPGSVFGDEPAVPGAVPERQATLPFRAPARCGAGRGAARQGAGRGARGAGRVTRGAGQVDEKTRIRELEEALERQLEETRALKRKLSQPVGLAGGEPASPRAACGPEAGPTALAGGEAVSPPAARRESASWRSGARSPGGHSAEWSGGDLHSRESASMRARSNRVTPHDPPDLEQGLGPHRAEEGGEGGARRAGGGRPSARDITRESSRESGGPPGGHLPHRFSKNSAKLAAEISASVTPRGAGPAGPLGRKADVAPGLQSLGQVAKSATAAQKAVDRWQPARRPARAPRAPSRAPPTRALRPARGQRADAPRPRAARRMKANIRKAQTVKQGETVPPAAPHARTHARTHARGGRRPESCGAPGGHNQPVVAARKTRTTDLLWRRGGSWRSLSWRTPWSAPAGQSG